MAVAALENGGCTIFVFIIEIKSYTEIEKAQSHEMFEMQL